jgi:hypothetical protein
MSEPTSRRVQLWLDRNELAELVAVLSSAVDRSDRDRIVACYAEESYDDHGVFAGSGREFADYICGRGSLTTMHHLIGQSVFDVQDDEAWGETFWSFHGTAGGTALSSYGRYVDHFRRIVGTWKLAYRRVVPDDVPPGGNAGAYWPSRRDRTDPSYDRLRRPPATRPTP